jgi:hypothetical protein
LFADFGFVGVGHDNTYPWTSGALQADGVTFSALSRTPGAWQGIVFRYRANSSACRLERCIIEYGGWNWTNSNIFTQYTSPTITECLICYSAVCGIQANGNGTPVITKCTFTSNPTGIFCTNWATPIIGGSVDNGNTIAGNTSWGVQNTTSQVTVDATYNWWGSAGGPSGVGPGSGDAVSSYVNYDPWRTSPIGDAPSPFDLLTPISGDTIGTAIVLLDWETAFDPTPNDTVRYQLQISTDDNFTPANTTTIDSLQASQYLATLNDDTHYWWRVTAFDSQHQETHCNQASWNFRLFIIDPPNPFALLTPDSMATVMVTSPLMTWQTATDPDPGDAITYAVYIDFTAAFLTPDSAVTTQTGVYPPFCQPGTLRYWKVKAADTYGLVTWSVIRAFYVHPDAGPRSIHDLVVGVLGNDIQLSWSEVAGADRYDIYKSDQRDTGFTLYENSMNLYYTDNDAIDDNIKFYRIIAVDNDILIDYWRDLSGNPIQRNTSR